MASQRRSVYQVAGGHYHARVRGLSVSSSALFRRTGQARTFCFGWWSGHVDREQQRELRRRHRTLRKLLGEQQNHSGNNSNCVREPCVNHDWQSRRSFAFGRYGGADGVSSSTSYSSFRSVQNFPEYGHSVWDDIFCYDRGEKQKSPIPPKEEERGSFYRHRPGFLKNSRFASFSRPTNATPVSAIDEEYVIDPITNRKVFKSSKPVSNERNTVQLRASLCGRKPFKSSSNGALGFDVAPTMDEMQSYQNDVPHDVNSGNTIHMDSSDARPHLEEERQQPDPSAISNSNEAGYMSWKYTGMLGDLIKGTATNHEDLDKYKPFKYNEPDGTKSGLPTEAEYNPEELDKYKPLKWNEPNGKPTAPQEELGYKEHDAEELKKYQPFYWNEPHGQPDTRRELGHEGYNPKEVKRYKPYMHNEPDGKPATSTMAEELRHSGYDQAEVQQYRPVMHLEADGKSPASAVVPEAHNPGEFGQKLESSATDTIASDEAYSKILLKLGKFTFTECEKTAFDSPIPFDRDLTGLQKGPQTSETDKAHDRQRLEVSASRLSAESDTIDKLASAGLKAAKKRAEKRGLMSAVEREKAMADPYSTDPQGLETAYAEESDADKASPLYVKVHKRGGTAEVPELLENFGAEGSSRQELYKILAYNPSTQTVGMVETTSTVVETASPLKPIEALLRLSNPSSFLPHFQSLRDQGFEIVSGSDNVLVFRKTHAKVTSDSNQQTTAAQSALPTVSPVSTVDKTGAQHVASSTESVTPSRRSVNIDPSPLPDHSKDVNARLKSSFKSNIRVRREEPVFSGARMKGTTGEKPDVTMGIGKRMLLGATWVGGVSYILGLVSEQLKG